MANKKISQLTSMGTVGIGSADYFVTTESVGGGNYATVKTTPDQVANYVLNPVTADQISGYNKNYFFNNVDSQGFSSWTKAGSNTLNFPYLQVDLNNGGKLVTGSGISVPAVGDDMGDCVATTHLDMSQHDIIYAQSIYFDGDDSTSNTFIKKWGGGTTYLTVEAENDLILSGQRHVSISGQALSLEDGDTQTPISGNVIITGGNLEIDPGNKLIVNEIKVARGTAANDSGSLVIEGASRHEPHNVGGLGVVYWNESNIQYDTVSTASPEFDFFQAGNGQTLTMYIENTSNSIVSTPTFISGLTSPNPILWGGTGGPPHLEPNRTNVYTFVCVNTGIFASAITGYAY